MSATEEQNGIKSGGGTAVSVQAGRSRIAFPYSDLSAATELARTVHENHGHGCDLAQLAGLLKSTTSSSSFRSQVSAAKIFGLIERRSRSAILTDRGAAIIDPQRSDAARAEAFLAVPLYRRLFDDFDGKLLPPGAGLEAAMRRLGVTEKSVSKARQIFQRSAETAGFFRMGSNRLVRPPSAVTEDPEPPPVDSRSDAEVRDPEDHSEDATTDPLLRGVWSKLPPKGPFPPDRRAQWLELAKLALDVVYGPGSDDAQTSDSQIAT